LTGKTAAVGTSEAWPIRPGSRPRRELPDRPPGPGQTQPLMPTQGTRPSCTARPRLSRSRFAAARRR
jgi:hypothetical protein